MGRGDRNKIPSAKRKLNMEEQEDQSQQKVAKRSSENIVGKSDGLSRKIQISKGKGEQNKSNANKAHSPKPKRKTTTVANKAAEDSVDGMNNNAVPNEKETIMELSQSKSTKTSHPIEQPTPGCSTECAESNETMDGQYDHIEIDLNAPTNDSFDESFDSEDGVQILPQQRDENDEEIPPEVVEKLKEHPIMQQYIDGVVDAKLRRMEKELMELKRDKGKRVINHKVSNAITAKSPSDTTLYKPGLNKESGTTPQDVINKISNFVEEIRIGTSKQASPSNTTHRSDKAKSRVNEPSSSRRDEAKDNADEVVLNAEHLKEKIQPPKGKSINYQKFIQSVDDDDEFFHVTCHIDDNLRSKISKGKFVDLERLLPKDRIGVGSLATNPSENRVELVTREGHTFFKPVKESQINGLRKWEQAFRIYAAIYTNANPERSGEIWQYIHTINVAASSYQWDNVATYDLTFRQLMSF